MQKTPKLTMPQTCMTVNFYDAALDYPNENFEQITRRMLGPKGFQTRATTFKRECCKAFDLGRQERHGKLKSWRRNAI
jgi:hypothetical protein